ncbi:MAG: hypothetical protein EXR11_14390 [Rhodospirillaceae bacterium]|nr:hypothetical protein [Rhodospirillaceae bacterium]
MTATTANNLPADQHGGAPFWANIPASTGLVAGIVFCVAYVALIRLLAPYMPEIAFAPDTGFAHYYWKLPNPTVWSHATAWGGYILHQASIWGLIYYAQTRGEKYSDKLHPANVLALAANALFLLLHLVQTHFFYDGTAQDTHIMTSQGSVIVLLAMVLVMENQRRGLAVGARAPMMQEAGRAMRKYHGYIFSWAAIYTFWYHPMETNTGHLMGTLYTTLIMVQGSLFFTKLHVNKYWMVAMEVMVLFHGTLVAIILGSGEAWAQFLFGFMAMFVITQMYGLGLPNWLRWSFWAAYLGGIVVTYQFFRGWGAVNEIFSVPVVLYGLAFLFAILTWGLLVAGRALIGRDKATA